MKIRFSSLQIYVIKRCSINCGSKLKFCIGWPILLFLFIYSSNAQSIKIEKVDVLSPQLSSRDGIFYSLPKTLVVIDVEVNKIEQNSPEPNKCDSVCEKILKERGLEKYKSDLTYVIKDYRISSTAIPDINQVYLVNPKKKWNKNKNINLSLSEQGLLQGTEVSFENKTISIITSGLKSIGSIVGSVFAGRSFSSDSQELRRFQQLIDNREALVSSSRYASDFETMKFQISEIDKLIEKELEVLIGTKKVTTKNFRFIVDPPCPSNVSPETNDDFSIELLRVDNSGPTKGIYLSIKSEGIIYPKEFISTENEGDVLKIDILEPGIKSFGSLISSTSPSKDVMKGFPYRIPKNQYIRISLNGDPKLLSSLPLAQCGSIAYLPYKMDKVNAKFYENLGSLNTVSVESGTMLKTSDLESIAGVISDTKTLIEGKSELEKLNEENTLLEAKIKNNELKEKLIEQ